jgi:hypothetical protein
VDEREEGVEGRADRGRGWGLIGVHGSRGVDGCGRSG